MAMRMEEEMRREVSDEANGQAGWPQPLQLRSLELPSLKQLPFLPSLGLPPGLASELATSLGAYSSAAQACAAVATSPGDSEGWRRLSVVTAQSQLGR